MADNPAPNPVIEPTRHQRSALALAFVAGIIITLLGHYCFFDRLRTNPSILSSPVSTTNEVRDNSSNQNNKKERQTFKLDLNRIERHELVQLPGMGPETADKILAFRDGNRPIRNLDELRAIRGIGDATVNRLRHWLTVEEGYDDNPIELRRAEKKASRSSKTKKPLPDNPIDINKANETELRQLPGIGPVLAQGIIATRTNKPFISIDDLRRVSGIGAKKLNQIRPYISVSSE